MEQIEEKSLEELLSCAEKYSSLYMLIYTGSPESKPGEQRMCQSYLNDIFVQLELRYAQETDIEQRARIICGLFRIIRETIAVVDSEKEHRCYQLCHHLLTDALSHSFASASVMKCIADYLYTCADEEDERFYKFYLFHLDNWTKEWDEKGGWEGITTEEADARLEFIDINSYMMIGDLCINLI